MRDICNIVNNREKKGLFFLKQLRQRTAEQEGGRKSFTALGSMRLAFHKSTVLLISYGILD